MTKELLAAGLKKALGSRDWSRARLSKESGVHINTVIRAVAGTHMVLLEPALAMARALDMSIEELIAPEPPAPKKRKK